MGTAATTNEAAALVLASASRARAEQLRAASIAFEVIPAEVDERAQDAAMADIGPTGLALRLARLKAQAVHAQMPERFVLGADQIAMLDGDPPVQLHKPGSHERAVEQLLQLAGRSHQLVTAAVLLGPGFDESVVDVHRLWMRAFERDEAERYVKLAQPIASAGAYHIEDAGIRLFERIEGADHTAIRGLPMLGTLAMLRRAGQLPALGG